MQVHPDWQRTLNGILPGAWLKWDWLKEHWVVWHKDKHGMPYIVMHVCYPDGSYMPVDGRTWAAMRRNVYIARRSYQRWMEEETAKAKTHMAQAQAHREDENRQMVKEMAPLAMTLIDANGASCGNSITQWRGVDFKEEGTA